MLQSGGLLLGGVVVLLVVLYAVTPGSSIREPTVAGPTAYPSIVLYPTLVPTPAPDTDPHLLDVESGRLEPIPVQSPVRSVLSDGTLLVGSAQGPATVVRSDGTLISDLPIPIDEQSELSLNNRYVAWIAGDRLQVYDAETAEISSELPAPARFTGSLSDGGLLTGDAAGKQIVIVGRHGAVIDRMQVSKWASRLSGDERRIAWVTGDGLHVYERSSRAERIYPEVQWVTGAIAWSPDGAEVAYLSLTGNNVVHVWVIAIGSSVRREVYTAEPNARIEALAFTDDHQLLFQVVPPPLTMWGDMPGARYTVRDDGSGGHFLDDPTALWATCGPSCGMPPEGYEDADGLARWCESQSQGGCIYHMAFVDRRNAVVHELIASDQFLVWSVSPDREQVAILFSAGTDQVLRIVRLANFTSRDLPLGFTYANNVTWFPGGELLLLWAAGGN